ncbi:E3 ubiquitin-protein ligase RNF4-like [Episyrphus balteatus]|uniref:E3 ubiquitin-protein ligase RNF4-like n=1 Tax=Episyrphus balteatus TaxID=286459 RepID=UPI0024858252|nr:E3 ubiquitin-protein ligase RNF4-like [Episyrphus balteatus]
MSALDSSSTDKSPTQNDDSLFDVDLIEVDDLLNSASRLLEEVYSIRPAIETSITSPREDAMEQVQRFLSSIRERDEEEEDVVFVEARPGNAPPASARTTAVVDLCTPNTADESTPETRGTRRRRTTVDIAPIAFPDLTTSPNGSNTGSRRTRRQAKAEPVDNYPQVIEVSRPATTARSSVPPPVSPVRGSTRAQTAANNTVSPNSNNAGLPALTCAVCMESVLNRQPASTSCGHIFCQGCIMQAIRLTSKCPLCNTKLNRTKVHRVYF